MKQLYAKLKKNYKKLFPSWLEYLKKELSECDSVLDLGCGDNSLIQYCNVPFSVGVELFEPYLQESKEKGIHNQYIKEDIRKVEFKAKSFDVVLCLQIVEHLTKEEGWKLIDKITRWAKKKIIITTPNGYVWQDNYEDNLLQVHKSSWDVKELEKLGFKVFGIKGWKKLRGYRGLIKYKPISLWERLSTLTQKITYWHPELASQLFAVKQIEENKK